MPESKREGVGRPEPPTAQYRSFLFDVFLRHERSRQATTPEAPAFLRFVESQTFWDRAMAEGIRAAKQRYPKHQVIGIMGSGHVLPGAVPHQLRALGMLDTMVLRPWDATSDCSGLEPRVADAVFGTDADPDAGKTGRARPRLGVVLSAVEGGVRIDQVADGTIAAAAGLRASDLILSIAGIHPKAPGDVAAAIARQAPGTWLPLRIRRADAELEIVAKFPPSKP